MTEGATLTKSDLIAALKASGEEVLRDISGMTGEEFEAGRYENGWNAREILAHMASIEWTYPRLIELAKNPPPAKEPSGGPPTKSARGGITSYNDRQVEKRAGSSPAELLEEFRNNRETTIRAVEETDEETLAKEIRSSGGFVGPLGQVLHWVAVDHVRSHLQDVLGERANAPS